MISKINMINILIGSALTVLILNIYTKNKEDNDLYLDLPIEMIDKCKNKIDKYIEINSKDNIKKDKLGFNYSGSEKVKEKIVDVDLNKVDKFNVDYFSDNNIIIEDDNIGFSKDRGIRCSYKKIDDNYYMDKELIIVDLYGKK